VVPKKDFDVATLMTEAPTDSWYKHTSKMSFYCENAMGQRKVYCPETENDCASPDCSTRICALRQERSFAEQRIAAFEAQVRLTNREPAAWRVVRELVAEHNALIDANRLGVALDINDKIIRTRLYEISNELFPLRSWDINDSIITARLNLPERRGRRARQLRETLVLRVLHSEKPSTVARLGKAMDAIVAEERARLLKG
jgi:hypothetical protein